MSILKKKAVINSAQVAKGVNTNKVMAISFVDLDAIFSYKMLSKDL